MPPSGMPPSGMPPRAIPASGMPPSGLDARLSWPSVTLVTAGDTGGPSNCANVTFCGGVPLNAGSSARCASHVSGSTSGIVDRGTPPRPFWLRFSAVKPIPPIPPSGMPPRGMPPRGMPPSGMPPSGMPPSGAPAVVCDSPRIASSGMPEIGAEAAPGSELSGAAIEIAAVRLEGVGPQSGKEFRPPMRVRSTWSVPSASAVQTSKFCPPASRTNAIRVPSGDQLGSASKMVAFVRLT